MSLQIGQELYDKCGQYFDDAHLNDYFRIEAIGIDWVIVRGEYDNKPQAIFGRTSIVAIEHCTQNQRKIIEKIGKFDSAGEE